jgi:AcrR family transcriptional regulator
MAESGEGSWVVIDPDQGIEVDLQPLFEKLKPGPGLPAEQVLADQRRRLHGAMIALLDISGWSSVRVRSLTRTAGVSTATFYKHFLNTDDCLASTYDAVMATTLRRCSAAQRRQPDWRESLRASVAALLEGLAAEPQAAQLMLFDVFAGGPTARRRIGRAIDELERLVSASFMHAPRTVTPPRHLVAGMTAGMLRVARTTVLAGRADELPGLADEVGDWLLSLPSPEVLSLPAASDNASVEQPRREHSPFPAAAESASAAIRSADRERLLRAALKLAATEGFASLTVPKLGAEAGVSRRRFDATFESVDECFLESVEMVAGDAAASAQEWSATDADWEQRTCRFVLALCAQAARNRAQARLAFLGIFATGRTGLLWRERMIGRMAAELRRTVPQEHMPSPIIAEASMAASWHIVQSDIAARRASSLPRVAPLLSYVLLAPMIGARTASEAIQSRSGAGAR